MKTVTIKNKCGNDHGTRETFQTITLTPSGGRITLTPSGGRIGRFLPAALPSNSRHSLYFWYFILWLNLNLAGNEYAAESTALDFLIIKKMFKDISLNEPFAWCQSVLKRVAVKLQSAPVQNTNTPQTTQTRV